MAMGTRDPEQPPLWIAASDLPVSPGHPFYTRLNALLDANGFDTFVEDACRSFSAPVLGRPSLAPGRYFRLLLVGYFEGIDSERGIIETEKASRALMPSNIGVRADRGWRSVQELVVESVVVALAVVVLDVFPAEKA